MLRLTLLGLLWAGGALAQSNHATGEFHYVGCVEISATAAKSIPLDPENCTPEACQQACTGYAYAAVHPKTCKCYNNIDTETQLPEEKCDNWCDGNQDLGRCGSCTNDAYSNLYSCEVSSVPAPIPQPKTTVVIPPYSAPAPVPTPAAQPDTSTSCVTIVSTPIVSPPSPAGPVSYGPQTGKTVVVQGTNTWTSTTRSTWTSTTRSTWTSTTTGTSTSTSYSYKPGYSIPPQPSAPAPEVPPGYGDDVNPPTPTVQGTPPVYGSGVVPATANPGYTSTETGSHPHSETASEPESTDTQAGAGCVSGSLFAVALALGVAIA